MTLANGHVVILGALGGRTHWRGAPLGGVSTAIVVEGRVYLVDFGRGWAEQFFACGLAASEGRGFETVQASFLTHLHADHVIDLPRLLLFGGPDGLGQRSEPLHLVGPGPRVAAFEPTDGLNLDVAPVNPAQPGPGTVAMMDSLMSAFASDLNDQIFDGGLGRPDQWLKPEDIVLPAGVEPTPGDPAPHMDPILVYKDDLVSVTAVLVDHRPMLPCFAYRFDTIAGSAVISGDTAPTENLMRLAKRANVLVHEAIDGAWVRNRFPEPLSGTKRAKRDHLLHAHTELSAVGAVAADAEVGHLIINHLGPPDMADYDPAEVVTGFDGPVTMGLPGVCVALKGGAGA